jgi:hypothetical protein
MQMVLIDRMVEILPNLQPQVVVKEETARKQEAAVAQANAGMTEESKQGKRAPVTKSNTPERNDIVIVTDGTNTMEMKYKKAEVLLAEGWTLVDKR